MDTKNCIRKHVPQKKIRKLKFLVIPTDYEALKGLVETRGIEPRSTNRSSKDEVYPDTSRVLVYGSCDGLGEGVE